MQVATTSTQRTYRYVRLSLVSMVLILFVAISLAALTYGSLGSVSAAYFTPARDVFVGSVFAISLALLALSGRSLSQALLDYAALLAPLIAIVPTAREPVGDDGAVVVPPLSAGDLAVGVNAFLIVAGVGVVAALVLAIVQRTLTVAVGWAIAIGALVVAAVAGWWLLGTQSFIEGAHVTAATAFFALMAAVSALAAWNAHRGSMQRWVYAVIAVGISLSLVFLAVVVVLDSRGFDLASAWETPVVLIAESVALILFAAFWLMQTAEYWNDPNPALRVASRP